MKTKPLARLGIPLNTDVWSMLKKVEDTPGVEPYSFFVDSSGYFLQRATHAIEFTRQFLN